MKFLRVNLTFPLRFDNDEVAPIMIFNSIYVNALIFRKVERIASYVYFSSKVIIQQFFPKKLEKPMVPTLV